jgi:hypothetical protein
MVQKRRKAREKFHITERVSREGFEEIYPRVRFQVRVIDNGGLVVKGTPSRTITLRDVRVCDIWETVMAALDR